MIPEVSKRGVLATLTRTRIEEIGRDLGVSLRASATKEVEVDRLAGLEAVTLLDVLPRLRREELRSVCRALGLDAGGRARSELIGRVLGGTAKAGTGTPIGTAGGTSIARDAAAEPYQPGPGLRGSAPAPGQIVRVRHRQYLVEAALPPPGPGHQTLARLVCLDDDAPGRELEVLWERELGAHILQPETHGLGQVTQVDPPRHFAAYQGGPWRSGHAS